MLSEKVDLVLNNMSPEAREDKERVLSHVLAILTEEEWEELVQNTIKILEAEGYKKNKLN